MNVRPVFFYGLFMDTTLLASKGVPTDNCRTARLAGFRLLIGDRATLVRKDENETYGVLVDVSENSLKQLYAADGLQDYEPIKVTVELADDSKISATSYVLPDVPLTAPNTGYTESLLCLADKLRFPQSYLADIRHYLPPDGSGRKS